MKEAKFAVTIDGKLIGQVDWSNQVALPKEGKVLVGVGGAEAHFDNFAITGDGIPNMDMSFPVAPQPSSQQRGQ